MGQIHAMPIAENPAIQKGQSECYDMKILQSVNLPQYQACFENGQCFDLIEMPVYLTNSIVAKIQSLGYKDTIMPTLNGLGHFAVKGEEMTRQDFIQIYVDAISSEEPKNGFELTEKVYCAELDVTKPKADQQAKATVANDIAPTLVATNMTPTR